MTEMAHDAVVSPRPRLASGLALALISAVSFGTSGTLARGLLDTGWSPGAATLLRVALAALVVAPLGAVALRGRWGVLRRNLGVVMLYGVLAVGAAQFCYFSAVQYMKVGPALLIEYTSPAVVVLWMWLRHRQRPGVLTLTGAALAGLGLVLVLDLVGGLGVSPAGVGWALGAMVGNATYFVVSADDRVDLPPLTLAGGGLVVGAVVLGLLGAVGLLPMSLSAADAVYSGHAVPVWVPVLGLGLVSAAAAYTTGIAAARRLGSRLAAFVALTEVLAAIVAAWLVLGEVPMAVQLGGGVLVVAGVVVVRLGEAWRTGGTPRPSERRRGSGSARRPASAAGATAAQRKQATARGRPIA
ncbi:DMT family transporter [Isoptericola sp. b441]|uniref:DMT family transporter n=1 Tax=Actinotalea lenta TaxID=3064654 RepID=A0ABT9D5I9_9CELL|nr:DMT family transporter [Isoptericola sp. b441]MDO8106057.1 DMT family transporter [Isoptericola sp. b441]